MKIVYLANVRIPTEKAHGVQIAKMCEAFGSLSEVVLVVPWRFNPIKKNIFEYYGVKNFQIVKLPSLDLVGFPGGFVVQSISFYFFAFFYCFFNQADIWYTREPFLAKMLKWVKKNVFLELHTIPSWLRSLKGVRVIAITRSLKQDLLKRGIDNVVVSPDGVDIQQFDIDISRQEARKQLSLPLDERIVLYAGHLYPWKGAHVLASAAAHLDALVVFVGGTKKDIAKFSFPGVKVLGHQPYSLMPLYLKAADVLVLPNSAQEKISFWTSPMKMFEYMASRRPIVASDIPSLHEVLNERNALLVEPDNPQKLALGIGKVLKRIDISDTISAQAFKDVQQYSWRNRAYEIIHRLADLQRGR